MENDSKRPDFSDVLSGSSSTAPGAAPAGSAASELEKQKTLRMYIVESGDSLSKIAKRFYGDAAAWKRIYQENRDVIQNPDLIQPGWRLRIPE
ncbi:MAG: LysM peptidoglycan-binding domain-containing protein [Acidobacteriota bacterium]|nr:LysM peptidoglycan-binding domain-containing protein [Acidobacteriota bacterium]